MEAVVVRVVGFTPLTASSTAAVVAAIVVVVVVVVLVVVAVVVVGAAAVVAVVVVVVVVGMGVAVRLPMRVDPHPAPAVKPLRRSRPRNVSRKPG